MTYHKVRSYADQELDKLREQARHFQAVADERSKAVDIKYQNATVVIREILMEAQIVSDTDVYVIDTSYLEEHGDAFIRIEPTADDPEEQEYRTLH